MEDRIKRLYEMFLRTLNFMSANAADFTDITFVSATVAELQTETNTLGTLGAAKLSATAAALNSTSARGDKRDELREDIEYIVAVWRSMPDETAGIESRFRMIRGISDRNLVATARSFINEAADPATAALLNSRGISAAFFTDLAAKTTAFEAAISDSASKKGERVGTNASFSEPARRAKRLVDKLTPTVKHKYRSNPQKLAEWIVASHVERPAKRSKKQPTEPAVPTQPPTPDPTQ